MVRKFLQEIFRRKLDLLHSAQLVYSLYEQQKEGKFCDLKVLVQDQKYFVHRCVLAASSAQLGEYISGHTAVRLEGVTKYGFERLLEILYSGTLSEISTIPEQKFKEIVAAADALNANFVLEFCARERSDLLSGILGKATTPKQTTTKQPLKNESGNKSNENAEMKHDADYSGLLNDGDDERDKLRDTGETSRDFSEIDCIAADVEISEAACDEGSVFEEIEEEETQNCKPWPMARAGNEVHPISSGARKKLKRSVCERKFSTPRTSKEHHAVGSPTYKPYYCDTCGMSFTLEISLKCHMRIHQIKKWPCKFCGKGFKLRKNLRNHIGQYHSRTSISAHSKPTPEFINSLIDEIQPNADGEYICALCDKRYSRKWSLKCHITSHSQGRDPATVAQLPRFECSECALSFDRLSSLRKHATLIHRGIQVIPKVVGSGVKKGKESHAIGVAENIVCWCKVCGKGFKRERNMKSHMASHKDNRFVCTICGRQFQQQNSLNGHLWIHGGKQPSATVTSVVEIAENECIESKD